VPPSRPRRRLVELRRARRLLALTQSLAGAATLSELAQRIADATRDLTGADQASVLLPDGTGFLRVAGVAAPPERRADLLEREPVDQAHLGGRIDERHGLLLLRVDETDETTRAALDALGIGAVALVATGSEELRAVVSAEWHDPGGLPSAASLGEVLAALARYASTALGNVALLDAAHQRALHDALTGLPNQVLFADRAAHAVMRARRNGELLAIGVLDLDRFKTVNDSLGHRAGDTLLVEVANRLRDAVRGHDTVARMGGDEFTLLLPDLHPHGEAIVAERLLAAFDEPFAIDGHAIRVSPSIGLATFPADGDTPDRLLRNADAAMYRAKENGRNTWATYASGMSERAYDRLTLEADLHEALERRELRAGYEPIALADDRTIAGADALIRWSHPAFGVLEANEFLPISEEVGIVHALDGWILRRACLELARADATGASPAWVAVPISTRSLGRPALLDDVDDALTSAGLAPGRLVIEVPELAVAPAAADVHHTLVALRRMGVRIALAQFGRASAPLATLADLPVDVLKLDRSFLQRVHDGADEVPVLGAVVALAHQLGLVVIADGVDSDAQLTAAARHGCDLVQGVAVGRAQTHVPAAEPVAPGTTPTEGG
jgi:diguanylate cyclase (GGDEF)-like protein